MQLLYRAIFHRCKGLSYFMASPVTYIPIISFCSSSPPIKVAINPCVSHLLLLRHNSLDELWLSTFIINMKIINWQFLCFSKDVNEYLISLPSTSASWIWSSDRLGFVEMIFSEKQLIRLHKVSFRYDLPWRKNRVKVMILNVLFHFYTTLFTAGIICQ